MSRNLTGLLWLLPLLAAGACGDGSPAAPSQSVAASVRIAEPARHTLEVGETVQLQASALSTDGAALDVTIAWLSRQPSIASVDSDGLVRAEAPGATWIVASVPSGLRDSTEIVVAAPPAAACSPDAVTPLEVGGVVQFSGAAAGSLCFGPGEYVAVPFFASQSSGARLALTLEASGVTGVVGPPSPAISPALDDATYQRDFAWEDRFRARERREVERLRAGFQGSIRPSARISPSFDVPAVGELLSLNTEASCQSAESATGRVVAISDRAIIVADTTNPAGGFSTAEYQSVAEAVDTLIYPVNVEAFGEPTDIDSNSRVIVFYTKAVNELTEDAAEGVVGGFFWAGDLLPEDRCAGGNFAEMFYMLAPDPEGTLGNEFAREDVFRMTLNTVGHELQHLINASRRIYILDAPLEEVWLNEALSHIAEELLFYRTTPYEPRQNLAKAQISASQQTLDAANRFLVSNLGRYRRYVENPDTVSLIGQDALPTRGAGWAFLRYAADREVGVDEAFFNELVNSTTVGLENVEEAIGAPALAWMQDWTVAVYADDAVAGTPATYAQPSWNFRSLLPLLGDGFPLRTTSIANGGSTFSIRAGGSIFARFGVAAGGAGGLEWRSAAAAPPPELRLSIQRTK
ncbi:MAG: Ig-like domain-containing protein [Gemmatimonadota bacterium]